MRRMSTTSKSTASPEATWMWFDVLLRSMRCRPIAWLLGIWLAGWALIAWHALHPSSWEIAWGALHNAANAASPPRTGREGQDGLTWLHELGRWGQIVLYASTGALSLYVGYALWVWRRYTRDWIWEAREERLQGGCVLEVLVPTGSKADARAAADMFGQLWTFLSDLSRSSRGNHGSRGSNTSGNASSTVNSDRSMKVGSGTGKVEAERLALSLEMWSTPHTDGKVCFYIWCPRMTSPGKGQEGRRVVSEDSRLIEEVRHLILAHYPGCRVRWVEDPLERSLTELAGVPGVPGLSGASGASMVWYELGLLADSRYPISSGASDERLLTGSRAGNRPGSPGAGSDPLAAVIGMLGSDEAVPILGIQVVTAARPETAGRTQLAVNQELARLRDLEMQFGKKALGPQHEARVLALEEKADRYGYDVLIRLVATERASRTVGAEGAAPASRAEARLASLLRAFSQYDRATAGVRQGLRLVRKAYADLLIPQLLPDPPSPTSSRLKAMSDRADTAGNTGARDNVANPQVRHREPGQSPSQVARREAPVLGRWPREGVCLPRMLPFMRMGRPCILNMAELSAIYHFSHQGLEGLSTLRWGTYKQIPPPAYARVTPAQVARGERRVLGITDEDLPPLTPLDLSEAGHAPGYPNVQRAVLPRGARGVGTTPQDLRRGSYVFGPMGSGKSVFLYNMIVQYMASGGGVGILDGKGDSYEEVLRLVPTELEGEVLAFDPESRRITPGGGGGKGGRGGRGGRSIGINPLDGRVAAQLGAEQVESLTMGLMKKMMGANWDQAVLMQRFLRNTILAVLEAEPVPTMLNLWRWLQDDGTGGNEYRAGLAAKISNQLVRDFWQNQVASMSSQQRTSMQNVLTRVDRYVNNDVRHVILQPYSTVNFQDVMDRGTIFVGRVSPRLGEDQPFLGALILNGFLGGAFGRQSIPQEQRRDYLLVVDEFQNFVDTAKADVERMLSMARGYRLGLMLAHQFTEQLPREVLSAILKNVQTWVLFGLQADDARLFAGYLEGLRAEDFQNLPPYHTYQRTIVGNTQTGVYSARPLPPPLPAANPGQRSGSSKQSEWYERGEREERERAREKLRAVHAPEEVRALVRREPGEGEEARRARILKLSKELYWPAEEGDSAAVQALSLLSDGDLELYRRARRRVLDKMERERILAHPEIIPDKRERIERLSSLRWGTPCVEVEALILATLRDGTDGADEPGGVTAGSAVRSAGIAGTAETAGMGVAPHYPNGTRQYSLAPTLTVVDVQDAQVEGKTAPDE